MTTPLELKKMYHQGVNISEFLRKEKDISHNTREIIEISYDIQAGSYTEAMSNEKSFRKKEEYCAEVSKKILKLCRPDSILEAGVGEATTLSGVLNFIGNNVRSYGFDLSWSRAVLAKKWLNKQGIHDTVICTGDLLNMPFSDNSIDIVYTSHSVEPNRGNEEKIIKELYRVTRKYLILLEPGYELSNDKCRKRMDFHGYCRNIKEISELLGYKVLEHTLFKYYANPLNPTAITIISKNSKEDLPSNILACPKCKTPLRKVGDVFYCSQSLSIYPIVVDIPCLRVENGILGSKFEEVVEEIC